MHDETGTPQPSVSFTEIDWAGHPVNIEYQWVGNTEANAPLMVFLHEGLGSLSMWKAFPQQLCTALGFQGLVYSRPGYGHSATLANEQIWDNEFMHDQAYQVLPALLNVLDVNTQARPVWLFGHSDGASIALLYGARFSEQLTGLIVLAPHIMVEQLSIESIEHTRTVYLETDLKQKLARHHANPDAVFWRWNNIWLNPAFRQWSITDTIKTISCPILAIQGLGDEYGTLQQIKVIQEQVPQTKLLELTDCRHSPHRDQPEQVIMAVKQFVGE